MLRPSHSHGTLRLHNDDDDGDDSDDAICLAFVLVSVQVVTNFSSGLLCQLSLLRLKPVECYD